MRAARHRGDRLQVRGADDVDAPVLAVGEAQDLLASDDTVLDDSVQRPADQFCRALGAHAGRHPNLAVDGTAGDPRLQRLEVAASERHFGQVKSRHSRDLRYGRNDFKRLADEEKRREAEKTEEAHDVGDGGDEHRR